MTNLIIGAILILGSGILGFILDVQLHIEKPALYWTLGGVTGIAACAIGIIFNPRMEDKNESIR